MQFYSYLCYQKSKFENTFKQSILHLVCILLVLGETPDVEMIFGENERKIDENDLDRANYGRWGSKC